MLTLLALQALAPIWIEAEAPASANVKVEVGAPGHPEWLSDGRWLTYSSDGDKPVPPEGVRLAYEFEAGGARTVWGRLGFEEARAPFRWRIDDGAWSVVAPNAPTQDLMELAPWNGVAWLKMGDASLTLGKHRLEIEIARPSDAQGKPTRLLYGADVFALTDAAFRPYGKSPARPTDVQTKGFALPNHEGPQRQILPLKGDWEIARDDETTVAPVATPMSPLDDAPVWSAIAVPGDKAALRPDLAYAHRVWYRTRFTVPKNAGRSFWLTFRQNSLNTTVVVNGKTCGFNPDPFVKWDCDITAAVREGVNELKVGIRDAWYGYQNPRASFALPRSFFNQGFQRLAYPVWGCAASGLLDTPELTVGGSTYAADVFVKPHLKRMGGIVSHAGRELTNRLEAQVLIKGEKATVALDVVDGDRIIPIAKPKSVDPGTPTTLGGIWLDPLLWWPDRPKMYKLRTTVTQDGKVVDVSETPFGFREWAADGPNYRLNGVVWHGWAELTQGETREEWLANYRKTGQRFARMSGPAQNGGGILWHGMPYDAALDWCDENGVVIRRCGPLDGEMIGYMAINDKGGINRELLENVRRQIVAQVRGERNHPSVNVWSVENEWLYINCINLYGGLMDEFEADMAKTVAAVREVDPTRLGMVDGGGAGKANALPVHGDHYVYTNDPNDYPSLAYTAQPQGGGRGRWTWDGKRPRYAGEDFYASGINPADYAWIQGEEAFGGKTDAHRGIAMVQRMITEGQRWGGFFAAWHLWVGDEGKQFADKYVANAERAVFVRQRDATFGSGQKVVRTLGVFNDSRFDDPLTVDWSLIVGGKPVQKGTKTLTVAPGTNAKFDVALGMPPVASRTPARLSLSLSAAGKRLFRDEKPLAILPAPATSLARSGVAVYDPGGTLGLKPTVRSLTNLPVNARVLIVGPNALTEKDANDPALAAYAYDGHRVVVLQQKFPLRYASIPLEADEGGGAYGFPDDPTHPVLKGLKADDLRAWGPDARLYERPYRKPERGARSIIQVGPRLAQSAVVEVPVGKGLLLLSQLRVGGSAPARTILANLIDHAAAFRLVQRPVRAAVLDPELAKALDAIGVRHTAADPIQALTGDGIAVVSATPSNLKTLAANLPKVRAFTARGGSLVLHGLTPEGLTDYNKLVGVDHLIRPFRREKVALATPRDPLAQGIALGDVALYSGERMFDYNADMFAASDTFSYVIDTGDVAPFAALPSEDQYNIVNGFVSADSWKYIHSFDLRQGRPETTMRFPRPLPLRELTWVGNGFYHKVTKIGLSFDGGPLVAYDVQPNTEPRVLKIGRAAQTIRLQILDWTKDDGATQEVVGIDNLYLSVDRSPKVKPLLNVGGLVRYPQGRGEIVLANLLFKPEAVPGNAAKKRAVLAALLRNLDAAFAGGSNVIVPGAKGVVYTPIALAGKATAYRNAKGWFGEPAKTLADLPTGRQTFGGVPFDVYDFPTSPVPTAVVLGGPGVPGNLPERVEGIKVGAKAKALFFLHTARIDERKTGEMARYIVTYADGSVARVPVVALRDVDDFRQSAPRDLPGARMVWSKPFAGGGESAAVYLMPWTNPRPDVAIASIGLEYGADRRGVPALLAVTAAN